MKKITILLAVLFCISVYSFSQNTVASPDNWKPVKIQADGKNIMNGVHFYRRPSECNSERVVIIKAINTNAFPVRINWKENNETARSIVIPANKEMDGNCNAYLDKNNNSPQKMLVFLKPNSEEKQVAKTRLLSQLEVTEEKN